MFAAIAMSRLNVGQNIIEVLHISEDDGGLEPYFMFINDDVDKVILNKLNNVLVNYNFI